MKTLPKSSIIAGIEISENRNPGTLLFKVQTDDASQVDEQNGDRTSKAFLGRILRLMIMNPTMPMTRSEATD